MYCLNDSQVAFILDDISARGIKMVSLQQDLLDHVCCVIEQELDDGGDFEHFYASVIGRFFKDDLAEIEVETLFLLTNKNYYLMKKVMMTAGIASVFSLTTGLIFKFMHWPGAALLIVLGIFALSFFFLPLLFVLKVKEQHKKTDAAVAAIGVVAAMFMNIGILFKIMHWPYASVLCLLALALLVFVFLPVYFITGIRHPATKTNTAITSILLLAGCAMILVLVRRPEATKLQYISDTNHFLRNESILYNERKLLESNPVTSIAKSDQITMLCKHLTAYLLTAETGTDSIHADFEQKQAWIGETAVKDYLSHNAEAKKQLVELYEAVKAYNQNAVSSGLKPIPLEAAIFKDEDKVGTALNDLIQIQMLLLQNQRALAMK